MKRLISMVVLAAGIALGSNAMAAEWNFYGSARVQTFWADVDDGTDSEVNYSESLQGNSRIGAKVKVSDELVGRFEYGADGAGGTANIRHLYGEWDFGTGKLLVGQTTSLLHFGLSNQVYGDDESLEHYGNLDASRRPMIRLTFGDFQIAAISPKIDDLGAVETQVIMPKLEAKYELSMDSFTIMAAAGYQTYEVTTVGGEDLDVDTYILAIGGKVNLGPAYIGAGGWFGQNVGPYGVDIKADADPFLNVVAGELEDNDAYGLMGVVGFKANDTLALEAGIGYVSAELDTNGSHEDDAMAYYLQATITLAKGVTIVPEIGMLDYLDKADGTDQGDEFYYGMKWQINF
ncbi:hypothetical protein [Desulfobacter vibrioformis]|uniref:hypothetical protein n=1 Tax=Desulfobacter vibrioformis TaxID=34031 RepID=UPI00054E7647|nr:hypothetical protein [Desulfobacter vibrioformis]